MQGYTNSEEKYIKNKNIAESVAEHTLNCWLLVYIFLPKNIDNNMYYNKQNLLNLLLIHDFAEVRTGDIVNKDYIAQQTEEKYMEDFLGNKTALFQAWKTVWVNSCFSDNSSIALDIDHIQAVYQYFCYYCESESGITKENDEIDGWLNELDQLHTDTGRNIAAKIILSNEIFLEQPNLCEKFKGKLLSFYNSKPKINEKHLS